MKVTNIKVNVKRLIALAKYENVTYEVGVEVSLNEFESPSEVYDKALAFCQDKILSQIERIQDEVEATRIKDLKQDEILF